MSYVESRMYLIAPNLSHVVGSSTAAKLLATAGGLTALSKIPACNLQVLGKMNKNTIGLSAATQIRHVGHIFQSELIQKCYPEYRKKVNRMVAAK
jgi:U4/U6 small nuclear ribonucleoprotein PRP31